MVKLLKELKLIQILEKTILTFDLGGSLIIKRWSANEID